MSLCAAACSWVVDPNAEAPRCSTEHEANPCEEGFECREGHCVATGQPSACDDLERCGNSKDDDCDGKTDEHEPDVADKCGDREDNDCDGNIDEQIDPERPESCGNFEDDDCDGKTDEGHDQDGDNSQWCGDTRTPDGASKADCDDYDVNVHVGAAERCNGIDDDCDGTIDENPTTLCDPGEECVGQRCVVPGCDVEGSSEQCGPTQMCDLASGQCVPLGCSDAICKMANPESFCDQTSGECRTVKRTNGEPCVAHEDCASRSCIDSAAMRSTVTAARVCGQACCKDTDCGASERCFAPGSGARSCLPVELVPYPPGAGETCTSDFDCPGATALCVVEGDQGVVGPWSEPRNDLLGGACNEPPAGAGGFGDNCFTGADCGSNACVGDPNSLFDGICSAVCRTSSDCLGLASSPSQRSYCRYVTGSDQQDYLPVCVVSLGETGSGGFGAACTTGGDCLDAACVGASSREDGFCAPPCCSDSQCPPRLEAASYCRPVPFGDHYEMRCVQ